MIDKTAKHQMNHVLKFLKRYLNNGSHTLRRQTPHFISDESVAVMLSTVKITFQNLKVQSYNLINMCIPISEFYFSANINLCNMNVKSSKMGDNSLRFSSTFEWH